MLCFSRDTEVLSVFNHSSASPINAVLKSRPPSLENTVIYPPSGVIPFHGFTMYGELVSFFPHALKSSIIPFSFIKYVLQQHLFATCMTIQ